MKNFNLQKIALVSLIVFSLTSCSSFNDVPPTPPGTASVVVSTLAGGGVGDPATVTSPLYGRIGSADGMGTAASFNAPAGIVMDAVGNAYISDSGNHLIRKVTAFGVVTTFAGNIAGGFENGTGTAASFSSMQGIAIDPTGNLYVADSGNQVIRKITPAGVVTTFAGSGAVGADNGPAASATFNAPTGVALDAVGEQDDQEDQHRWHSKHSGWQRRHRVRQRCGYGSFFYFACKIGC
jgi:streptogramin lyase